MMLRKKGWAKEMTTILKICAVQTMKIILYENHFIQIYHTIVLGNVLDPKTFWAWQGFNDVKNDNHFRHLQAMKVKTKIHAGNVHLILIKTFSAFVPLNAK